MFRALSTASSGMEAQQTQIDIIANNLANANVHGFKKARGEFQDMYYQQLRQATDDGSGGGSPIGLEVGQGVRVMASQKIFTQGDAQVTGGHYDMSIKGQGFFKVQLPDGEFGYTRAGSFAPDQQGQLVMTGSGNRLDPGISIPPNAEMVTVEPNGIVKVKLAGQQDASQVGQLTLALFQNPAGLQSLGGRMYGATEASGEPLEAIPGSEGVGSLAQGELELSNVKVVEEMISLISAQRAYEMNSKVVQTTDQMLRDANNLR